MGARNRLTRLNPFTQESEPFYPAYEIAKLLAVAYVLVQTYMMYTGKIKAPAQWKMYAAAISTLYALSLIHAVVKTLQSWRNTP